MPPTVPPLLPVPVRRGPTGPVVLWRTASGSRAYAEELVARREDLARLISRETGKLLWEARTEVAAMIGKVEISIRAQAERAGTSETAQLFGRAVLRHHPHGVMAVLGPYNFPGHLPNGHIVPALIAGNTVVFKPSEQTPAVGAAMVEAWHAAGVPAEVLQVVQGGRDTGAALIDEDIDGLLFTGSATAGGISVRRSSIGPVSFWRSNWAATIRWSRGTARPIPKRSLIWSSIRLSSRPGNAVRVRGA
jgi:acyl-CoA reductase-like NAD-dependent aldehyde dehydrogenase